jgi:hypothetical protein
MFMLILRVTLIVCFIAFLIANIVAPAFMRNVPFFWMFRIRKQEKKYKEQLEKLDNQAMENAVLDNIEKRKQQTSKESSDEI